MNYEDLLAELECPVCFGYMYPPISMCISGHSICTKCKGKLAKCPLCQECFAKGRNITLEAISRRAHFPCVNKDMGCILKLTLTEKCEHEKICTFREFSCQKEQCSWKGRSDFLIRHWETGHLCKILSSPETISLELKRQTHVDLVKVAGKLFWFKCRVTEDSINWAVQFMGDSEEAVKYYYDIEIFKPDCPKPTIVFSNYCSRNEISNQDIFETSGCCVFHIDSFKKMMGPGNFFNFKLTINSTA